MTGSEFLLQDVGDLLFGLIHREWIGLLLI